MTQYFYVDSVNGDQLGYESGVFQGQTNPTVPLPDNSFEVTVAPDSPQMSWDFVNNVWFWKKTKLRDYARIIRAGEQENVIISWKGLSRPLSFYLNVEWERMFDSASEEVSTESRAINTGRNFDDILVATNAEIVALEKSVNEALQRLDYAYNAVAALIENATITITSQIDTQWPISAAAYSNARTALAPLSEIAAALVNKVDKVSDKGLSTEDFSSEEKNKLSALAAGANLNLKAYVETTSKNGFFPIFKEVTVDGSGNAIIHLTDTGLAGGAALFPNGADLKTFKLQASENSAPHYAGVPVLSNSNKTLTVPVTKSSGLNISILTINVNVLGVPVSAAGSVVKLTIWGN